MNEDQWRQRAESAEAKFSTAMDNIDRVKEKLRGMMDALGAKERSDGTIDIDFAAFVSRLSLEHAVVLRAEIDQQHHLSGAPGEKPRLRLVAQT